jgi:hypothetical protein
MDIGFSPIYLFFFFRFFIAESQREQKRSSTLENNAEMVQGNFIPDSYVPEQKVPDVLSLGQRVPWMMHPLDNAFLAKCVP